MVEQEHEQLVVGEDLPAEAVEDLHGWQAAEQERRERAHNPGAQLNADYRRKGLDPVVELPDGTICWASELDDQEIQAERAFIRQDLAAPPGREHEGPL
jgi:hypothetical protein